MRDAGVDGFYWQPQPWGLALRLQSLDAVADHFFTSLPLRLRGTADEEERDWAAVAETIGVPPDRLVRLTQVHGRAIRVVHRDDPGAGAPPVEPSCSRRPDADIVLSDDPRMAITVQVADCVPLLLADRTTGAVAAAHAGWRGTALNVAGTAIDALRREFGSRPEDVVAAHGPSIGACCYEVGEELVEAFRSEGFGHEAERWFSRRPGEGLHLDLWTANQDQLVAAGVPASQVHLSRLCTASHPDLFPSYRRDGKGTGRVAAVIRARPLRPTP
jgi:polyphenol oxidase